MAPALPLAPIAIFTIVLWVIAISLLIAVILGYIAGVLHGLPYPVNQLAGPVNGLAKGITSVLFKAVHMSEQLLGAAFHQFARYWDKLWHTFLRHSAAALLISTIVGQLVHAFKRLEHQVAHGAGSISAVLPRIRHLEREFKGIEHGIKDLSKLLLTFGGIDALVHLLKHLIWLRNWVKGQIAGIRTQVNGLSGSLSDLKRFLGVKNGLSYLEWAAGIVTAVIGIEAVNLFKCPTWLNQTSRRGCGLWNGIEDLFGFLADLFIFTHFCDLWAAATPLLETFLSPLVGMISTFADGACSHRPGDWQTMGVSLDLPTPKELTVTVELP